MHSCIIQISRESIKEEDFITPADYFESDLIGRDIDYVSDEIPDREKELEDFKKFMDIMSADSPYPNMRIGHAHDGQLFAYFYVNKASYFKASYKAFRKAAAMLQLMTKEEFSGIDGADEAKNYMREVNEVFTYGGNNYRVNFEGQNMTLTEFMRIAEEGNTAYSIGGILNYHV